MVPGVPFGLDANRSSFACALVGSTCGWPGTSVRVRDNDRTPGLGSTIFVVSAQAATKARALSIATFLMWASRAAIVGMDYSSRRDERQCTRRRSGGDGPLARNR